MKFYNASNGSPKNGEQIHQKKVKVENMIRYEPQVSSYYCLGRKERS